MFYPGRLARSDRGDDLRAQSICRLGGVHGRLRPPFFASSKAFPARRYPDKKFTCRVDSLNSLISSTGNQALKKAQSWSNNRRITQWI